MDGLRKLGIFNLEKKRPWGDLTVAFQYLKGAYRKAREGFFIRAGSVRTKEMVLNWKMIDLDYVLGRNSLL